MPKTIRIIKKPKVTAKIAGSIKIRFNILLAEKEYRDGRKYTYADIHDATGLATSTITDWAQGNVRYISTSTLGSLISFFNCEIGDLLEVVKDHPKS